DLSGRPTLSQAFEYLSLEVGLTQQPTSPPTPALGLLLSVRRLITDLSAAVAFKLARYSRWRAIHNCRDLADCFPGLLKSGKRTALFKAKAVHSVVPLQHLIQRALHLVCEFRLSSLSGKQARSASV